MNTGEINVRSTAGQSDCKDRTSLLLNREKEFVSFGWKSLVDYHDGNNEECDLLFERYKLNLQRDVNGHEPIAQALNGEARIKNKSHD